MRPRRTSTARDAFDFWGGLAALDLVLDTGAALDEGIRTLRALIKTRPIVRANGQAELWRRIGLVDVVEVPIVLSTPGTHQVLNVGCGRGYTVLEVLAMFAEVTGRDITPLPAARRAGGDGGGPVTRPGPARLERRPRAAGDGYQHMAGGLARHTAPVNAGGGARGRLMRIALVAEGCKSQISVALSIL